MPTLSAKCVRTLITLWMMSALLLSAGCRPKVYLPEEPFKGTDPAGLDEAQRRLLFAQIVDDPRDYKESAILEGKPFKYFLRLCAAGSEGELSRKQDRSATTDALMHQPNLYRGHVIYRRGVVIEAIKADLSAEYNLPGCAVIQAILLLETGDVFELRMLTPQGSDLFARLDKGIQENKNPVVDVAGFFFKLHAKMTSKQGERPWRVPLLVCPEPDIFKLAGTVDARKKALDLKVDLDDYLPSRPIEAPRAEERFVVEQLPANGRMRVDGKPEEVRMNEIEPGKSATGESLKPALREFLARLPENQREKPAAVVLVSPQAVPAQTPKIVAELLAAGWTRIHVKDESEKFSDGPQLR